VLKPSDIVVKSDTQYNVHENYLTLNSGELQGIKPDMGVIQFRNCWYYENTSPNYATVISILNKKSQINAKIKKSNHLVL
jgi:rod shape-determining protein MreC